MTSACDPKPTSCAKPAPELSQATSLHLPGPHQVHRVPQERIALRVASRPGTRDSQGSDPRTNRRG